MIIEVIAILVAIFMAAWASDTSPESGAAKKAEALAEINKSLASPEGLHEPWWLPSGKVRDGLLSFGIDQICRWEKRLGFFATLKGYLPTP